jgi:hypothetical protein
MTEKTIYIAGIVLLLSYNNNCLGQITSGKMDTINNEEAGIKRRADTISIDSPISALLEIKKEEGLIALLTLTNTSGENVLIDKNKLGGDNLKNHIFHLSPWYTSPNLTFKPYTSFFSDNNTKEEYIIIKPQERIKTQTNLSGNYDFNERKYDILSIIYHVKMKYLDMDYRQITARDIDGIVKPLDFHIESNKIELEYKDIAPPTDTKAELHQSPSQSYNPSRAANKQRDG